MFPSFAPLIGETVCATYANPISAAPSTTRFMTSSCTAVAHHAFGADLRPPRFELGFNEHDQLAFTVVSHRRRDRGEDFQNADEAQVERGEYASTASGKSCCRYRRFVRSNTTARGWTRIFSATWPYPTSTPYTFVAPLWSMQSVNPPVLSPESKHTHPSTSIEVIERLLQLQTAATHELGLLGDDVHRDRGLHLGASLRDRLPVHQHLALRDPGLNDRAAELGVPSDRQLVQALLARLGGLGRGERASAVATHRACAAAGARKAARRGARGGTPRARTNPYEFPSAS